MQIGDFYIIRSDKNGDTLWTRTFGFTNLDFGASGKETSDGGFVVAGTSWDTIVGHNDIYLIKYDSTGNIIWDKRLKQNVENVANNLIILPDGRIIISGTIVNSGTLSDFYLVETNSTGDTLWTKTFGEPSRDETSFNMSSTLDGGFILCGTTAFNGSTKAMIVSADSSGNLLNNINVISFLPQFTLYPNPAIYSIYISLNSEINSRLTSFRILDLSGQLVKVGLLKDLITEIDVSGIGPGAYFISLLTDEKSLQTIKFILTP